MSEAGKDIFGPPPDPVECICLHCDRTYSSDLLIKIDVEGDGQEVHWMCPVPGCGAMGYGFDIFPTNSTDPANGGWVEWDDDDGSEDDAAFEDDGEADDDDPFHQALGEQIADEVAAGEGQFDPPRDWSPEIDREDDDADGIDSDPFGLWDDEQADGDDGLTSSEEWRNQLIPGFDDADGADADDRDGVTHPSMVFTRDDYEAAKAAGVYDEAVERERQHWRQIRQAERERKARIDRGETIPGDEFSEDDIPF
jgi:hypothetical protein